MSKETISFRCPKITGKQLEKLQQIDQDNRSQVIIRAIDEYYRIKVKREQLHEYHQANN